MSALGQKRTFALQKVMSALIPIATAKADIGKACTGLNAGPNQSMNFGIISEQVAYFPGYHYTPGR
jgi:hypothetical protein